MDEDAPALQASLRQHLEEIEKRLHETASAISPGRSLAELFADIQADRIDPGDLIAGYRERIAEARSFVIEQQIATLPEGERLRVEPIQPLLEKALTANAELVEYYVGPLRDATFFVTPADPADDEQTAKVLARHTRRFMILNAAYETYPGKRLRLAVASCRPRALARQLGHFLSPGCHVGWAIYAEELMADWRSATDPLVKLLHLRRQRERCVRALVDVSLHSRAIDLDEAAALLAAYGGSSSPADELLLILQDPGDWQSHFVGYLEIKRLVADYRRLQPGASLRQAHDAVLRCGLIPPRLVRQLLLDASASDASP